MLISSKFKKDSETPERIKQNKSFDYSMIFIHTIPVTSAGHLVKCSINIHYWYYIYIYVQFTTNRTFYIRVCVLIYITFRLVQFSSVQSLSCVRLSVTPWITACQASLSNTNSGSSLRLTSIESVMPSSHLILCCPLLFLPPIPPSNRVISNESTLRMRWPKYCSFSFSIIPSKEIPGLISFRMDWLDLLSLITWNRCIHFTELIDRWEEQKNFFEVFTSFIKLYFSYCALCIDVLHKYIIWTFLCGGININFEI